MRIRFSAILNVLVVLSITTVCAGGVFEKSEYERRRAQLMKSIPDGIALFVGAEGEKQNSNFIYFTGVEDPDCILIIDGIKKESTLFLPEISSEEKIKEETGIEEVRPVSHLGRILFEFQAETNHIYTPFDRDDAGYQPKGLVDPSNRLSREVHFINQIKKNFPSFRFSDLNRAIAELRVIKSPAEIEVMREAARISSLAYMEVLRSAEPGMYEWELEAIFEYEIKRLGGQGFGYPPIIPSDPKWYDSHYSQNSRRIKDGDIVMPDVGGEYGHYVVDISSTFPINGKFTPEQKRLNGIIYAVEEAMRKVFRPGIRSIDMEAEVREILAKQGIDLEREGVYRIEANHWIGLDVHDVIGAGISSKTTYFKPGMVVASDPAIKIRDKDGNVIDGVKIENTVLITEDGCENLTHLVPRTVEEIEEVMAEEGIYQYLKKRKSTMAGESVVPATE